MYVPKMQIKSISTKTANTSLGIGTIVVFCLLSLALASTAFAKGKFLYLQSNNVSEGQNSIIAYERLAGGGVKPLANSPFLTHGTGINNSTNGKLGPNDNDTPLVLSPDGNHLYAVNGHSNTIAGFNIQMNGSLRHVQGSPFDAQGIGPVSLAISSDILVVANRNEDPHQLDALRGAASANYASFRINPNGSLSFISKVDLVDGQKPTQVLVSQRHPRIVFGNDFQVDVDFDGDGPVSQLFSREPLVRGRLHAFMIDRDGRLNKADSVELPETASPAPDVPSIPLGLWDHPTQNLVYVGFVTRNELGVYRYDDQGKLTFVTAVPNSGQDICWLRVNQAGTRLFAVNNLPREDAQDKASTVTVFDIADDKAEKPVEIGRVELPMPLGTFVNNRNIMQPNSAAFQLDIDPSGNYLCVISQRINQTDSNPSKKGNILHMLKIASSGHLTVANSHHLGADGVHDDSRPQGIVTLDK